MNQCNVCTETVVWGNVTEIFEHLFERADRHGTFSLSDCEHTVYAGHICSAICYQTLKQLY